MEGLLPAEILSRPKRGFGPPFGAWLHAGLLDYARQLLLSPRAQARGLLDPDFIDSLLARNLDEHRVTQQIWMLLILEVWFRIFIDGGEVASPPGTLEDLL
jgi:asparagine synthase (glutamine-hydrolysing)